MATFYLREKGQEATWRIEADTLLEAIRQLDGFEDAAHVESAAPGATTLQVYRRAPAATRADWSYLGTVRNMPAAAFIA